MLYQEPTPGQKSGNGNSPPPTNPSPNQKEVTHKWADIEAAFHAGKAAQNYGKGAQARSAATSTSELPPHSHEADSQEISVSQMFSAPPLAHNGTQEAEQQAPGLALELEQQQQQQQQLQPQLQDRLQQPESPLDYSTAQTEPSQKPLDQLVATVLNAIEKSAATGHSSFENFFEPQIKSVSESREVNENAPTAEVFTDAGQTTCTDAPSESSMNINTLPDQNLTTESLFEQTDQVPAQQNASARVVNSSLVRLLGNLAKDNTPPKDPTIASFPHFLQDPKFANGGVNDTAQNQDRRTQAQTNQPEARHSIGLELKKGDEVRDAGQLGRAKIRLAESRCVDQHEQIPPRPIDPYRHVNQRHGEMQAKYQSIDCRLSKSLRPDGTYMEVRTAADYSTLTTIESANSTSMVVHDRYRRPVYEHYTVEGGAWIFSEMNYADDGKIHPFPTEKLTVNSDGTVTSFFFSDMGQLKNRYEYPALLV